MEGEEEEAEDKENWKRYSKDAKMNKEGRRLVDFIEERGWIVFNGKVRGNEDGEFTFTEGLGGVR